MAETTYGKYRIKTAFERGPDGYRSSYCLYARDESEPFPGCSGRSDWCKTEAEAVEMALRLGIETAKKRVEIDEIMSR